MRHLMTSKAQPLVAAARILQSTAQNLRRETNPPNVADLDDLSFHAALAFAMHGNFPSARAALSDVSSGYLKESLVFRMVAAICDPSSKYVRYRSLDVNFNEFRSWWYRALRHSNKRRRTEAFENALELFTEAAKAGTMAEYALLLGGRMAANQARRLATVNLLTTLPKFRDGLSCNPSKLAW